MRGDKSDSIFFLIDGRVKVYLTNDKKQEVILNYLAPGECFGTLSIFDSQPRAASVMSLTECKLFILSGETLLKILNQHPAVNLKIMNILANKVRNLTQKIENFALKGVYARVASTLVGLATIQDGMMVVEPRPTHKDIANMVGASREMVTRVMSEMALQGHINKGGNSSIINHDFEEDKKSVL
ncbi:MAG: Crp/Fnr family transcriptional regulator [Thiotrichaceae bacterium]|nr:Crp/Fnr family transcriptional regulator [Thiotrichaceae bacterium]